MRPIRCDPRIHVGVPCLAGTRVPTQCVWSFWQAGYSLGAIQHEYPALSQQAIWDAILFEHRRHQVRLRQSGARQLYAPAILRPRRPRR